MKIISVKNLAIPEVKVIRFGRYCDQRGYFSEIYKKSVLQEHPELTFLKGVEFVQSNESFSRAGTIRGLHFQWNPPQSKLVRVVQGKIVDLALDIRKGSPTLGKIIAYELTANFPSSSPSLPLRSVPHTPRPSDTPLVEGNSFGEWLWVPAGFAHGFIALEETLLEYFCTAEWNPKGEAGISPLSGDLDWSLCDSKLKKLFEETISANLFISDKDRNGYSFQNWLKDSNSDQFTFTK